MVTLLQMKIRLQFAVQGINSPSQTKGKMKCRVDLDSELCISFPVLLLLALLHEASLITSLMVGLCQCCERSVVSVTCFKER